MVSEEAVDKTNFKSKHGRANGEQKVILSVVGLSEFKKVRELGSKG